MTDQKIILLRGISGSGKTTWAETYQAQNPNTVIISRDDFRLALYRKDYGHPIKEDLISQIVVATLLAATKAGHSVIIDNTNVNPKDADVYFLAGLNLQIPVDIVEFDVTVDYAMRNNQKRKEAGGRFVPEHVIRTQHENLKPGLENPYAKLLSDSVG